MDPKEAVHLSVLQFSLSSHRCSLNQECLPIDLIYIAGVCQRKGCIPEEAKSLPRVQSHSDVFLFDLIKYFLGLTV